MHVTDEPGKLVLSYVTPRSKIAQIPFPDWLKLPFKKQAAMARKERPHRSILRLGSGSIIPDSHGGPSRSASGCEVSIETAVEYLDEQTWPSWEEGPWSAKNQLDVPSQVTLQLSVANGEAWRKREEVPITDVETGDVTYRGVTKRVFDSRSDISPLLFATLVQHRDNPLTVVELIGKVWKSGNADVATVRQALTRLRRALKKAETPFDQLKIVGGEHPTIRGL